MHKTVEPIPACFADGCTLEGPFGFKWGDQERHACRLHRFDGRDWLAKIKGVQKGTTT